MQCATRSQRKYKSFAINLCLPFPSQSLNMAGKKKANKGGAYGKPVDSGVGPLQNQNQAQLQDETVLTLGPKLRAPPLQEQIRGGSQDLSVPPQVQKVGGQTSQTPPSQSRGPTPRTQNSGEAPNQGPNTTDHSHRVQNSRAGRQKPSDLLAAQYANPLAALTPAPNFTQARDGDGRELQEVGWEEKRREVTAGCGGVVAGQFQLSGRLPEQQTQATSQSKRPQPNYTHLELFTSWGLSEPMPPDGRAVRWT